MACEFPVAVKSYVDVKLLYTVYFTYFTLQNEHIELKPGLVTNYELGPGNGTGLFSKK